MQFLHFRHIAEGLRRPARVGKKAPACKWIDNSKTSRQLDKQAAILYSDWQISRCSKRIIVHRERREIGMQNVRTVRQADEVWQTGLEVCKYAGLWVGRHTNKQRGEQTLK